MPDPSLRRYEVHARSTETFGRVLCGCRDHHFIVDGPVQNGCPGEEVTPAEFFLSGVAACGVELVQVIAREKSVSLGSVRVAITGEMDPSRRARPDLALFSAVRIRFHFRGTDRQRALELVEAFKGR